MPDTVIYTPEDYKISPYDENQLSGLEIEILHDIQENGRSGWMPMDCLRRALRMGFTAVSRGEAEGQMHPPKPSFMLGEEAANTPQYALVDGKLVETESGGYVRYEDFAAMAARAQTSESVHAFTPDQGGKYKVGDFVAWGSRQSNVAEKAGAVAQVLPPGERPDRNRFPSLYTGAGVGQARDHVSYVVEVPPKGGSAAKPKVYWPRATSLQPVPLA